MASSSSIRNVPLMLAFVVVACVAQGCGIVPRRFDSAEQAAQSLAQAVRTDDKSELRQILGREPNVLDDEHTRETFLKAYDEKHRVDATLGGYLTLVVGNDPWVLPIPLVRDQQKGKWFYDTKASVDMTGPMRPPAGPTTSPAAK